MINFAKKLFVISGLVPLAIGIMHLGLPTWGFDSAVTGAMTPEMQDHFINLALYAIAVFLLAFSIISFFVAKLPVSRLSVLIGLVFAAVWIVRGMLEILFPVNIALYGMKGMSHAITVVSFLTGMSYVFASYLFSRSLE